MTRFQGAQTRQDGARQPRTWGPEPPQLAPPAGPAGGPAAVTTSHANRRSAAVVKSLTARDFVPHRSWHRSLGPSVRAPRGYRVQLRAQKSVTGCRSASRWSTSAQSISLFISNCSCAEARRETALRRTARSRLMAH
jgi:hypothetical protein